MTDSHLRTFVTTQRFSEPDGELNPFLRLLELKSHRLTESQWSKELQDIFLKLARYFLYHTDQPPKSRSKNQNLDLMYKVNTVLAVDISKFFVDFAPMVYLNLELKVTSSTVWLSSDDSDGFQFYIMAERNRMESNYLLFTIAYQHPKLLTDELTPYDKSVMQNISSVFGPIVVEVKPPVMVVSTPAQQLCVSVKKPYFEKQKQLRPYDFKISLADFYEPPK